MRFKHIRYVVLLGAFAIIGIIAIQLYFVKKEWSNKEKQFAQTIASLIGLKFVANHPVENAMLFYFVTPGTKEN